MAEKTRLSAHGTMKVDRLGKAITWRAGGPRETAPDFGARPPRGSPGIAGSRRSPGAPESSPPPYAVPRSRAAPAPRHIRAAPRLRRLRIHRVDYRGLSDRGRGKARN